MSELKRGQHPHANWASGVQCSHGPERVWSLPPGVWKEHQGNVQAARYYAEGDRSRWMERFTPELVPGSYNPIAWYEPGSTGNDLATRQKNEHLNALAKKEMSKPTIDPTQFAFDYVAAKKAPTPLITPPVTPPRPSAKAEAQTPTTSPSANTRSRPAGGPVRMVMHPVPSPAGTRDITRLAGRRR